MSSHHQYISVTVQIDDEALNRLFAATLEQHAARIRYVIDADRTQELFQPLTVDVAVNQSHYRGSLVCHYLDSDINIAYLLLDCDNAAIPENNSSYIDASHLYIGVTGRRTASGNYKRFTFEPIGYAIIADDKPIEELESSEIAFMTFFFG